MRIEYKDGNLALVQVTTKFVLGVSSVVTAWTTAIVSVFL